MKFASILLGLLLFALAACSSGNRSPAEGGATSKLVIYSTTDRAVFDPVMRDFAKLHPEVAIDYVELDAQPLYERFRREAEANLPSADILLSSAMDLQVKLVNDGFAQAHQSKDAALLPSWARWRNEIFGLTFEPVVMVANRRALEARPVPKSRLELVQSLQSDRAYWKARLGTFDISNSSVGYLLASQDARLSSEFGALIEAMGDARTRTYQNTSALLDDLEAGRIALGYNVLGSYAKRRAASDPNLQIIYSEDYTLAVVRAAFIAKHAKNGPAAHIFLEYLLSLRGQRVLAIESNLSAVREEIEGPYGRLGISGSIAGPLRPIPIGPGLMTYLDSQKRERFLRNWTVAMDDPSALKPLATVR